MYILQRKYKGVNEYYTGETWTRDRLQAKEYRLKVIQIILNFLLEIIKIIGVSNIKIIKK